MKDGAGAGRAATCDYQDSDF